MRFVNGVLSALIAAVSTAAVAQGGPEFPRRPVRLSVPYAPGGASDTVENNFKVE